MSNCHGSGGDVVFLEDRDTNGLEQVLQAVEGWVLIMPGDMEVAFVLSWFGALCWGGVVCVAWESGCCEFFHGVEKKFEWFGGLVSLSLEV